MELRRGKEARRARDGVLVLYIPKGREDIDRWVIRQG
jgi:hypothetical protein